MAIGTTELKWLIAIVDLSFLPIAGALAAQLIIKAKSYRNLQFIPIIGLLTCANLLTHLSIFLNKPELFSWGMYAAILLVTLLMVVVGGRVIPLFTSSGTQSLPIRPKLWLEKCVLVTTWLVALIFIVNRAALLPASLLAILFSVAAISNAYRAYRWRGWTTFSHPLVWSLHLAYWFIPIGFALFALKYAGTMVSSSTALHSLTAGAMGSLILSMIARVSLGHSGRPLIPHKTLTYAFVCIVAAGILRLTIGWIGFLSLGTSYLLSAGLWILAYGIFVFVYFQILITPRPDGKPG